MKIKSFFNSHGKQIVILITITFLALIALKYEIDTKMVVFGTYDEENGCCGSLYQLCGDPRFKTKIAVKGGILEEESLTIIQDFYNIIRKNN